MRTVKIPYCTANHQASNLCCDEECDRPAVICENLSCENSNFHNNCPTLKIQNVLKSLQKKSESEKEGPDQILDFYIRCIKLLTIDMEEYKKTKQNHKSSNLRQDEQRLFKLLKNGPSKQITPKLVYKVSKSLKKQPILNYASLNTQISSSLSSNRTSFQSLLSKIKTIWCNNNLEAQNIKIPLQYCQKINDIQYIPQIQQDMYSLPSNQIAEKKPLQNSWISSRSKSGFYKKY